MQMDITVTGYPTYADLQVYTHGSAMVIGLMMLPVLGPADARTPPARPEALGEAFQLSNFIRDVGEDLPRGRVYLPQEDLDRFGVTRERPRRRARSPTTSASCSRSRSPAPASSTPRPARASTWCDPTSRPCLRTAIELYGGILDEVERADYQVLDRRVSVPARRRARSPARRYLSSLGARRWQPRLTSRRPQKTHQASDCSTSAKPKPRSSTGAKSTARAERHRRRAHRASRPPS